MMTSPTLILLDCQREHMRPTGVTPLDATDLVVARIRKLLVTARNSGWDVMHSHFRTPAPAVSIGNAPHAPIDCLKPLAREPVFVRSALSAYSDQAFDRAVEQKTGSTCLIVGFSAPFSLLATAFDAAERGHRLFVVPEAVGSAPVGARSASTVRDVAFDLIDRLTQTVDWEDVFTTWVPPSDPEMYGKIGLAQ